MIIFLVLVSYQFLKCYYGRSLDLIALTCDLSCTVYDYPIIYELLENVVEFIRKHVDIANEEERMLEISRIKANEKEIQKS